MPHTEISPNIFDCDVCHTRCDGKSKLNYQFKNDVDFAEEQERLVIDRSIELFGYKATKTERDGYPDLELRDEKNDLVKYVEVKAQRRTFMSVERLLPQAKLKPSETLALNLSDLLRYFQIKEEEEIPIYLLWTLSERLCLTEENQFNFYYQDIDVLKEIYEKYESKRRFRRQSGSGDVVDGVHKGVVVNYHFSLNELIKI